MGILDGIDVSNPCLVWPRLQEAYYRLLAGDAEASARFGEDEVEFHRGDAAKLKAEITRLQVECNRRNGKRSRFAMRGTY